MGEHPRGIEEFANLTDWQIVQTYFADAAKVARERKRAMDGLPPQEEGDDGAPVKERKARRDKSGKPVPKLKAVAIAELRKRKFKPDVAEAEYGLYLKRFNKQHGTDYR